MAVGEIKDQEQISAVREFNRFYTARLGLLRKCHRRVLLQSLANVRSILNEPHGRPIRIVCLSKTNDDAIRLLHEYYEAVSVVQRDAPGAIRKIINGPGSGMWLAYIEGKPWDVSS
jgi:hypothetical protein